MFEKLNEPIISPRLFFVRMVRHVLAIMQIVAVSLLAGVCGYHFLEHLDWLESLLNASMILGGMGPVDNLHTTGGKVFASFYAIYSGLFLIGVTGVMLAPVFHRVLHKFHYPEEKDDAS